MADGADEIIFPDVFARFLAINAAKDYCGTNGLLARLNWLEGESQKAEVKLLEYTAGRNKAKRLSINFKREEYGFGGGGSYGISDKTAF